MMRHRLPLFLLFAVSSQLYGLGMVKSVSRSVNVKHQWIGLILPGKKAVISSRVNGDVVRKHYHLGQFVEAQSPLIDVKGDVALKAEHAQQEAYNLAKKNYESAKYLEQKGAMTIKDCAAARIAFKNAEAQLAAKRDSVQATNIKSPFAGVVCEDHVDQGSMVHMNSRICNIASREFSKVHLTLSYQDAQYISNIEFFDIIEDTGHKMPARLYALSPFVEANTGGVNVVLECEEPLEGLFGATVQVFGVRTNVPDVHVVPYTALHFEDGKLGIMSVEGNVAQFFPAEVLSIQEGEVYLTGLPEKIKYIAKGHGSMLHGEKINLNKCNEEPAR